MLLLEVLLFTWLLFNYICFGPRAGAHRGPYVYMRGQLLEDTYVNHMGSGDQTQQSGLVAHAFSHYAMMLTSSGLQGCALCHTSTQELRLTTVRCLWLPWGTN